MSGEILCDHCGARGNEREEHSCPCPHPDQRCPDHLSHEQKHTLVIGKVDGMYIGACTCDDYDWQTDDREMLLADHWLHMEWQRGTPPRYR
jgi:hypothetical protein